MTGLNWFEARSLAVRQKRAIRRAGWTHWMYYRFSLWLIEGGETARHVATASEFTSAEFLAKDWTDEPWDGGSYPPCTTPGPAPALVPSSSGGMDAWTTTAACAGAGEGGGVLPAEVVSEVPPSGLSMYFYAVSLVIDRDEGVGGTSYNPPLTEPAPREMRGVDAYVGIGDVWTYAGAIFVHYTVTGDLPSDTEIVGLWGMEAGTTLEASNLVGLDDYDAGDPWDESYGNRFFGHTLASHGTTGWYYLGTTAALAEPYPDGGVGFMGQTEGEAIVLMLALRSAGGGFSEIVQGRITLPLHAGGVVFWNEEQSFEATCPSGEHGDPVTVTVPAGTYSSSTSLAAANATALAVATADAEAGLVCVPDFWNVEVTAYCEAGTTGDPVTVAAHTFSSTISQEDADAQALAAAEAALVCVPD